MTATTSVPSDAPAPAPAPPLPAARAPRPGHAGTTDGSGCIVTVCRDCCCASATKHPGVDHDGQLARLRGALAGTAQVRVSTCLDVCEQSNVVVVNPSPAARRAGARPVWLGHVLDPAAIDDIIAWVDAAGPGVAPRPATLDLYAFAPPRKARQSLAR